MSQALLEQVNARFGSSIESALISAADGCVTVELNPDHLLKVARALCEEAEFQFGALIDICGVDYHEYGDTEWRTEETTLTGFSRGKDEVQQEQLKAWNKPRFASVYHLLSYQKNQRIRLRVLLPENNPSVPSVNAIWNAANWFEREAFDLFGIIYEGHPDLRRILTDYGFVGHPFRKDFPLIGEVELRYDAEQERCVYGPVSIQARMNVPKAIRSDNRYISDEVKNKEST